MNSYNKRLHTGVRIGNWVEEAALHDLTGEHRYIPWAAREEGATLYPHRARKPQAEDTFRRVILHTKNDAGTTTEAAETSTSAPTSSPSPWSTTQRSDFNGPDQQAAVAGCTLPLYGRQAPRGGRRAAVALQAMAAEAYRLAAAPVDEVPATFETTSRADYVSHDLSSIEVGKRVAKDR